MNRSVMRFIVALGLAFAPGSSPGSSSGTVEQEPPRRGITQWPAMPRITEPVMFNVPAADRILSSLQIYPADNPWNEDISQRPVHRNSRALVASVGPEKSLAYNLDMAFILVPPNQKRVSVRLTDYRAESDPGPYPIPEHAPIEGWPLNGLALDVIQRVGQGDRHLLVVDPLNRKLFEFYSRAKPTRDGRPCKLPFLT